MKLLIMYFRTIKFSRTARDIINLKKNLNSTQDENREIPVKIFWIWISHKFMIKYRQLTIYSQEIHQLKIGSLLLFWNHYLTKRQR